MNETLYLPPQSLTRLTQVSLIVREFSRYYRVVMLRTPSKPILLLGVTFGAPNRVHSIDLT
jgi:hypothetical protein